MTKMPETELLNACHSKWHILTKWLPPRLRPAILGVLANRRGAIAPIYAVVFVTMMMALGAGMDISNGLQVKYQLDLASDAAAVACGETWQSYMEAGTGQVTDQNDLTNLLANAASAATTAGTSTFQAQAGLLGVTGPANPSVNNPTILVKTAKGATSPSVSPNVSLSAPNTLNCVVQYKAENLNYLMQIAGFRDLAVQGQSTTTVVLAPYVNVYLILDTSASMMVGSTPTDQRLVAEWVAKNDTGNPGISATPANVCAVFAPNSAADYQWLTQNKAYPSNYWVGGTPSNKPEPSGCDNLPMKRSVTTGGTNRDHDITPCAFACHDTGQYLGTTASILTVSDMQQGETVAHQVGATTRFDVMKQALVNDPETQDPNFCNNTGYPAIACANTCALHSNPGCLQYEGLLPYIRDTYSVPNARANLSTFSYSLYGFNWGINGNYPPSNVFNQDKTDHSQDHISSQTDLTKVAAVVNALTIGINTHLNTPVNTSLGNIAVLQNLTQNIVKTTSTTAGACTPGTCASNPLKFVILITDGLNSDRNWNWGDYTSPVKDPDPIPSGVATTAINWSGTTGICALWTASSQSQIPEFESTQYWAGSGTSWSICNNQSYNPGFYQGFTPTNAPPSSTPGSPYYVSSSDNYLMTTSNGSGTAHYVGPIQTSWCNTMKANGGLGGDGAIPGVTIAVLETPYVPMTGQDPIYYPFEGTELPVIWPSGNPATHASAYAANNGRSAISQALYTCASAAPDGSQYYYQATDDSVIASGFKTLFDKFVGTFVHISD